MNSLSVSIQDTIVGKLFVEKDEYHFEYDTYWKHNGFAISLHIWDTKYHRIKSLILLTLER